VAPFPFLGQVSFSDFMFFDARFRAFHTPGFITLPGPIFTYPAVSAVGQSVFYLFPHPLVSFLTAMVLTFVVAGVLFYRRLRREQIGVRSGAMLAFAFLLSYPIWFEFVRANCEFLVWCVLTVGLWALVRRKPYLAAACFGVAGAMKLYPFIFLGLLVSRKQYRQLLFGLAVSGTAYVSALWLESGSVALSWRYRGDGLASIGGLFTMVLVFYDHSLFELVKYGIAFVETVLHGHKYKLPWQVAARAERWYLLTFGVAGLVVFFAWIRKVPLLNQIVALAVLCVLLPPLSFDYTLIQLYFPCALLIFAAIEYARKHQGSMLPGLRNALLLMAVILAPETELSAYRLTVSSLIKWVSLIALFVVALRQPFSEERGDVTTDEDRGERAQPAPALRA
jgi:hypothetical protein